MNDVMATFISLNMNTVGISYSHLCHSWHLLLPRCDSYSPELYPPL